MQFPYGPLYNSQIWNFFLAFPIYLILQVWYHFKDNLQLKINSLSSSKKVQSPKGKHCRETEFRKWDFDKIPVPQ